jgi:hypothetical protein
VNPLILGHAGIFGQPRSEIPDVPYPQSDKPGFLLKRESEDRAAREKQDTDLSGRLGPSGTEAARGGGCEVEVRGEYPSTPAGQAQIYEEIPPQITQMNADREGTEEGFYYIFIIIFFI